MASTQQPSFWLRMPLNLRRHQDRGRDKDCGKPPQAYYQGYIDGLCTRNICVSVVLLTLNGQHPTADNIRLLRLLRDNELVNSRPSLDNH
jgi:hypothetical protein